MRLRFPYAVRILSAAALATAMAVLLITPAAVAARPSGSAAATPAAQCAAEEQRVASVRTALERQQRTMAMGEQLREEGTAQALEAQKNAFWSGIRMLLERFSTAIDGRAGALAGLQQRISTDTLRQMGKRDSPALQLARRELASAEARYRSLRNAIDWNKILKFEMELDAALDLVKSELALIARTQQQLDTGVKSVMEDEHLADILASDTAGSDFAQSFYSMTLQTSTVLKSIMPFASATQFLTDSMYNLGNSVAGTTQALRQAEQRTQDLKAVESLKLEMQRAVTALNDCRAAIKPPKKGGSVSNGLLLATALAAGGALAAAKLMPKECGEAPLDDYYNLCPGGAACSSVKREYGDWCKCNGYSGFDDNRGCY